MNPLLDRLAVVRRRYRLVTVLSGVCAVAALMIGVATLFGLFDYANYSPRLLRASVLVGMLACAGVLVYKLLIDPLARRSDNLSLALRIEVLHPELNDALASTIQFLEQPNSTVNGDPAMRARAIEKATKQAASFDFFKILDYRFFALAALALVVTAAAAAHFLHYEPELSQTALLRLVDPFGHHPWTRVNVPDPAHRIAVGQPFRLKAVFAGVVPPNAKIEIQEKDRFTKKFKSRPDTVTPIKFDMGKRSGSVVVPLDVTQRPLEFRYRILAGDGAFPSRAQWQTLEVLEPPTFAELNGLPSPQLTLHYPAYTDLPSPAKLSPGTRHIGEMIQGTVVEFRAAVDRPLKSATIEIKPLETTLRPASLMAFIGSPALLPQLGPLAFQNAFSWFHPIALDGDRMKLSARFRPWVVGSYAVHLVDDNDLIRTYDAEMRLGIDPVPVVRLLRPSVSQSYLPTAEIPVKALAEDDIFAVRSVFLEYRKKNAQGDWLDAAPTRIDLHDPNLNGAKAAPGKPKRLEVGMLWKLTKKFQPGDIISLQAGSDDYCDLFTPRRPGLSHEIEIRIVSPDNLARELDQNLAQVQQELAALKKLDDEAQKLLDDIPKDKQDPRALDQAIEAAQKVKQVQERIGARPDEGLRDKLEKMQQTIKDNKLPNSEVQDQAKALAQELERLIQEDFPKLEQNLNDLRKDLAGASKAKTDDKKSPLEKSKETNQEVQKTLADLSKSLDRWSDLAQLKGQTRELLEKQRALNEEVGQLKDMSPVKAREERNRIANQQNKVEQDSKDLVERINKVKRQQDEVVRKEEGNIEEGDKDAQQRADEAKDASKRLDKARGAAKQDRLNEEMNKAAEELRNDQPNAAQQKQEQAARTLEKMVKALDGEKDDDIDRLRKKQKQANAAQDKLEKLKNKVEQAQKNPKAGGDKDERQKQADELRGAAEELREQARQLQRLQERKAARELQRAADNLDAAAKKMEAGEAGEAENLEMEAQEHIEKAQKDLEHLQQELAREQLAQIGDRLKALKERQDATIEQTKELQTKVEARKQWTRGLIETLENQRQSQVGLAKETQGLEEKLKGALVFEHILKKAGKAMEQAGQTMAERKAAGKDWLLNKFDAAAVVEEKKRHDDTVRLQKLAADRLDRLLDAIKDAPPPVAKEKKERPKGDPEGKEPEQQGGMRAQDGIPPTAQLKALKAEQVEVYERTKDFARDNPNPNNLDEKRQRELLELTEEQGRLRQLFEQMTSRREGEMP